MNSKTSNQVDLSKLSKEEKKAMFMADLIEAAKADSFSNDEFTKLKMKLCKLYRLPKMPTNIEILMSAEAADVTELKNLVTKPTRSLSGVAVVAVMTKPHKCPHGKCITCPGGVDSEFGDVPQSYTGTEPATMRGMRNNYDPYIQIMNRLEQYIVTGHVPDKVELIIMGGTFISTPKRHYERFVSLCFKAMNDFSRMFFPKRLNGKFDADKFREFFELPGDINDTGRMKRIHRRVREMKAKGAGSGAAYLEKEQKKNESSKIRCVSLVMETRPDYCKLEHINEMLRLGCTKVELGVQSIYNNVLEIMNRGHTIEDSIEASATLRDLGFKINYHMMPGLPKSSMALDRKMFAELFHDDFFKPDMLKIYPCMVMKGTKLYDMWKAKKFRPITTRNSIRLIRDVKKMIPPYVRVMRVQRDIPTKMTEAGVGMTNLRQIVHNEMAKDGEECSCIRCREVGRRKGDGKFGLKVYSYLANGGMEFFISVEDDRSLLGFCRLRFPSNLLREEVTSDSAFIRELHVYGSAVGIGEAGELGDTQHKGWGKKLLAEAERICKESGYGKAIVISGVGVRGYYRKLGYRKEGPYMVKKLK